MPHLINLLDFSQFSSGVPQADPDPVFVPNWVVAHIHASYWPYHRLATLSQASGIISTYRLMEKGSARVQLANTDTSYTSDIVARGNILVIESNNMKPWVGPIINITENKNNGLISIQAEDMFRILDSRVGKLSDDQTGASGVILANVLKAANARGHTGVYLPSDFAFGPPTTLPTGGQSLIQSLKDASQKTDWEFGIFSRVSPSRIESSLIWTYRIGEDQPEDILWDEDVSDVNYTLDVQGIRQSVTVVGGTGRISSRVAVTTAARGSLAQGKDLGTAIDVASETYQRAVDIPASLRTEHVVYRPLSVDRYDLANEGVSALERPVGSAERFNCSVLDSLDWSVFHEGDYIRIVSNQLGPDGVNRKVRVISMSTNWETGILTLELETPIK